MTVFQHIVKTACNAVWRFTVGKYLSKNNLSLMTARLRSQWQEFPGIRLPGVVHQRERGILNSINPHIVLTKASVIS